MRLQWFLLTVSFFYLVGTAQLIPGSIFLYTHFEHLYKSGINLFVSACACLVIAALVDVFIAFIASKSSCVSKMISIFMLIGGTMFEIGSLMYLPQNPSHIQLDGTWVFRFGSVSYIIGSCLSLYSLYKPKQSTSAEEEKMLFDSDENKEDTNAVNKNAESKASLLKSLWTTAILLYIIGALLYITGGILSETKQSNAAFATTWVVGSCFFVGGAAIAISIHVHTFFIAS
eukprot:TRINITY_DN18069_c0_g1_i1.p1 TRINITY_DN18069_c0_g1~~TRINITY_DN18069_c0_g1_i1.p1  ORF type:complete len:230 (+),score=17.93 TRINITY_DN18069_c0_g1_i1:37-726(+)